MKNSEFMFCLFSTKKVLNSAFSIEAIKASSKVNTIKQQKTAPIEGQRVH
jgi:hypothetical protein